jgi:RNA-directed DNA polymerase
VKGEGDNSDADVGCGGTRSSEETAVMAAERRGSAIRTFKIQQPETGGFMEKGKSFEITQEEVLAAYKCVKANIMGPEGSTRGVEIPKKNGKTRLLGIPTIEDRIAQMVVRRRLEPLVEPVFLPDSYGNTGQTNQR